MADSFESRLPQLKADVTRARNDEEKAAAQAALGRFWYFIGLNLCGYDAGRGPSTMGSFKTADEHYDFFKTVPSSCSEKQAYAEAEPLLKAAQTYYRKLDQERQAADVARDLALLYD